MWAGNDDRYLEQGQESVKRRMMKAYLQSQLMGIENQELVFVSGILFYGF